MKEESYKLEKGQYLGNLFTEIPNNCILSKKLPGIGATTLEIQAAHSSIIIVPNVPVIHSKCEKHQNLFGVFEGVKPYDIKAYLKKRIKFHKIMTTPESFPKIKTACTELNIDIYDKFYCVLDECHQLIKDVDYREDIVLPMQDFFLFKQKALISATPIPFSAPEFENHHFKIVKIEANFDYRQEITTTHTNNVLQATIKAIKQCKNTVCFFINSTDTIYSLIKQLNILEESSVFCSPKSRQNLKDNRKFKQAYSDWSTVNMRKYNFFTSRFFNAFDMDLEEKPDVIMITSLYFAEYTMLDINTDCVQIVGRFRNGVNSLRHIYDTDRNIVCRTREELENEIKAHEYVYNTIDRLYKDATDENTRKAFLAALETIPFNKYIYGNGEYNYFAMDNYINENLVRNCYQSKDTIEATYKESDFFISSDFNFYAPLSGDLKLKLMRTGVSIKKKRKEIVDLLDHFSIPYSEEEQNSITELRGIDPLIVEAYEILGKQQIEELNYSGKAMREALILSKMNGTTVIDLIKENFKVNKTYTNKQIVEKLTEIYDLCNVRPLTPIKGNMIKGYFEALDKKTKNKRGYLLVCPKI